MLPPVTEAISLLDHAFVNHDWWVTTLGLTHSIPYTKLKLVNNVGCDLDNSFGILHASHYCFDCLLIMHMHELVRHSRQAKLPGDTPAMCRAVGGSHPGARRAVKQSRGHPGCLWQSNPARRHRLVKGGRTLICAGRNIPARQITADTSPQSSMSGLSGSTHPCKQSRIFIRPPINRQKQHN